MSLEREHNIPKKSELRQVVQKGIGHALDIVHTSFEPNPQLTNPENELTYHTTRHTKEVVNRTARILEAINAEHPTKVDKNDIFIAKLAAGFHDTVQDWEPDTKLDESGRSMIKRKRKSGLIERKSAELATDFMEKSNETAEHEIFKRKDFTTVTNAINLTVPTFDPELKTVIQADFTKSELVPQAVALADLGGAPMDGNITYESLALFDEENLDYKKYVRDRKAGTIARDPERETFFHDRLVSWIDSQKSFLRGRQGHLQIELASMDKAVKPVVEKLFDKFPNSFSQIDHLLEKLKRTNDFDTWNRIITKGVSR